MLEFNLFDYFCSRMSQIFIRGHRVFYVAIQFVAILFLWACSPTNQAKVDQLNALAYHAHYKSLDTTQRLAARAYELAGDEYIDGKAEALNNLAFVNIAKMDYGKAKHQLAEVCRMTDNQIEKFVADIQMMRICQREAKNKDFYTYREKALQRLKRIEAEMDWLPDRLRARMVYAQSELKLVSSTYYYYVGLEQQSTQLLEEIGQIENIALDTAQYLNYLYSTGAGSMINADNQEEIEQTEFDYLMRCYHIATQHDYTYWRANALQALSEHLLSALNNKEFVRENAVALQYLNEFQMPDTLLAGYLAQQALEMFKSYGDVYQIAAVRRTLAQCFWTIGDYRSALASLNEALEDSLIAQAPDMIASVREQMSVLYSAMNNKPQSDYNRNIYLDLQETTRQDRQLEARAEQLNRSSRQLNYMILSVILMILALVIFIFIFIYQGRKLTRRFSFDSLLSPLEEWQRKNIIYAEEMDEECEEISVQQAQHAIRIANGKKNHLASRAKIAMLNSQLPFIDRMIIELKHLCRQQAGQSMQHLEFVRELSQEINKTNDVLTRWIQMQQGTLNVTIESFPLQQLFDMLGRSKTSFALKGVSFQVSPSSSVVKADKVLTLFMLNTLADNARKFTPEGGAVRVFSSETEKYVEISVEDTGKGMSPEELSEVFNRKIYKDHGFGLMNCRGIIEKYRKLSSFFSVCSIHAESQPGKGSRISFRLPHGLLRAVLLIVSLGTLAQAMAQPLSLPEKWQERASHFADSAYYSNINGTYEKTIQYADSCRKYINQCYRELFPEKSDTLVLVGDISVIPAEIQWLRRDVMMNYAVILDIRNETAVAALALHLWKIYQYNNKVYTHLYKESSADRSLAEYCRTMQKSESNKTIAVVLLVFLLLMIISAYYFLYYRHRLYERYCVEKINQMNDVLLSDMTAVEKMEYMNRIHVENFPEPLRNVINKILSALQAEIQSSVSRQETIEMAEDELKRSKYEEDRLHIANNVLDNCLSTLKHETMYYPSRIEHLLQDEAPHFNQILELAVYYKELYQVLMSQAARQIDSIRIECGKVNLGDLLGIPENRDVYGDADLLRHMFDLLKRENKGETPRIEIAEKDADYLQVQVDLPALQLTEEQCQNVFTPSAGHIPFLLCRQIIRDCGDATRCRATGFSIAIDNGTTKACITLPQYKEI